MRPGGLREGARAPIADVFIVSDRQRARGTQLVAPGGAGVVAQEKVPGDRVRPSGLREGPRAIVADVFRVADRQRARGTQLIPSRGPGAVAQVEVVADRIRPARLCEGSHAPGADVFVVADRQGACPAELIQTQRARVAAQVEIGADAIRPADLRQSPGAPKADVFIIGGQGACPAQLVQTRRVRGAAQAQVPANRVRPAGVRDRAGGGVSGIQDTGVGGSRRDSRCSIVVDIGIVRCYRHPRGPVAPIEPVARACLPVGVGRPGRCRQTKHEDQADARSRSWCAPHRVHCVSLLCSILLRPRTVHKPYLCNCQNRWAPRKRTPDYP